MAKVHAVYDSSNSEQESENEENSEQDEEDVSDNESGNKKTGLADVMAKILRKNIPQHKQTILCKSKSDKEIRKRKAEKTEEGSEEEEESKLPKVTDHKERISKIEKKKIWEEMGRVKPGIDDREKEKNLQRIAQRGVVQLFNAVRKQQKIVEEKIAEAGSSERKKEKVMGTMTKGKFLDILKGTENGDDSDEEKKTQKSDKKSKSESGDKKWDILREDFMMGAKMKDWDKESSDEGISLKNKKTDSSDSGSE